MQAPENCRKLVPVPGLEGISVTQCTPAPPVNTQAAGAIQTVTGLGPGAFDPIKTNSVRTVKMVEAPLTGTGTPDAIFTRTLAALRDQSALISLSTSGFTVLPFTYDAAVPIPQLDQVVSLRTRRARLRRVA